MTKEDAISKAADWWTDKFFSGVWDNGDAFTEVLNAIEKSITPKPTPPEASTIRAAFLELMNMKDSVYCDYGNSEIDVVFKKHNLPYSSSIHCPQKSGTRIFEENGEWFVEAKLGYGKPFERI